MKININLYNEIKKSIPIVCVDLIIVSNNKFLLLKRNNPPAEGQWWFPGGRIYKNELIFQAVIRKAKEELNISVRPIEIVSVGESIFNQMNDIVDIHTINIVVKTVPIDKMLEISLDNFHSDYKWFENIENEFHSAVRNPLIKMGFRQKNA